MKPFSNESVEDYLETILTLSRRFPVVRGVDIANELNFKKSSVSIAMKKLREKGHIRLSEQGYIELTESGLEIAGRIYERHEVITDLLVKLGVAPYVAAEDACRVEHFISEESFQALKKLEQDMK